MRARGLDFALWMSPPIDGAMTYRHDLLWPAFAQWDLVEHSSGGGIALLAAAVEPSGERRVVTFVAAALTFLDASSA